MIFCYTRRPFVWCMHQYLLGSLVWKASYIDRKRPGLHARVKVDGQEVISVWGLFHKL